MEVLPEELIALTGKYLKQKDFDSLVSALNIKDTVNINNNRYRNIFESSKYKNKLFLLCVNNNDIGFVKFLLDNGVNPNVMNDMAINIAASCGYTEIVKMILSNSINDASLNFDLSFTNAAKNGYSDVVETLLQDGRLNSVCITGVFFDSLNLKHFDIAIIILKGRFQPVPKEWVCSCLCAAAQNGADKIVKFLICDFDPNMDFSLTLPGIIEIAVKNKYPKILKVSLNHPQTHISYMSTALMHIAIKNNDPKSIQLLLNHCV
jgi:ankyrin repeat protein